MTSKLKSLAVLPFLLLTLSGCLSGGTALTQRLSLAEVPGEIRGCFTRLTGRPMPGEMSRKQITKLVTDLRTSEQAQSNCGRRLLALYDAQNIH